MLIYAVHTFGRTPQNDEIETDENGRTRAREAWGDVTVSYHDDEEGARLAAQAAFRAEPEGSSSWVKSVQMWHPHRDLALRGRMYLWSLLPSAAPASNDPNRDFYPQMRPTSFYVETIEVQSRSLDVPPASNPGNSRDEDVTARLEGSEP